MAYKHQRIILKINYTAFGKLLSDSYVLNSKCVPHLFYFLLFYLFIYCSVIFNVTCEMNYDFVNKSLGNK